MLTLAFYVNQNSMQEDGLGKEFEKVPLFLIVSLSVATHGMNLFLLFSSNLLFQLVIKNRWLSLGS